ncbi:ribonuclease Z [Hydrobacter penzbergensis]|jgi:ribonuclease Z|uniref:Ribonuclease Z n=1 Tax=Hydrobacter penzbergensis TaxID=1235997 RepID=A0A8X8LCK8_9BACT|nr:ribonuclease Z [Hydrobacter penzbergensis]SDW07560.1 ribonuclease Z [Hydrobacter penzbergensis]
MFGVTILGNNSALPAYERHPTAQVVTLNEQLFLIDCGEGTQMQLARYKVKRGKINHIFISHLHGDHYFGLLGLITSMGLLGREQDLHIYAPPPLKDIIHLQLEAASTALPFTLHFHPLEKEGVLIDHPKFSVSCFATRHRIPCWGFIIREKKKPRKIDKDKITAYQIPAAYYERLKEGLDYETRSGEIIKNEWVTRPGIPPKSYAFCADTIYDESIADKTKDVSLLYHETTYLKDLEERAAARYHSTTLQAAAIAQKANASKLLIGHFSSKYETLETFLEETIQAFPNTQLAIEGVTYYV